MICIKEMKKTLKLNKFNWKKRKRKNLKNLENNKLIKKKNLLRNICINMIRIKQTIKKI